MHSNFKLTEEIIRYILSNIKYISSNFKLDKFLEFELDMTESKKFSVFGISYNLDKSKIEIIFTDLSLSSDLELIAILKMDDNPAYGLLLSDSESKFMINYENVWIKSDLGIQAKFLAGFEDLQSIFPKWQILSNNNMFSLLTSFIGQNE